MAAQDRPGRVNAGGGGGELEKWANLMQDDSKAMCMCGSGKIYFYTWPHPPLPFVWHDGLIAVSTTITITSGRASPPQAAARQFHDIYSLAFLDSVSLRFRSEEYHNMLNDGEKAPSPLRNTTK